MSDPEIKIVIRTPTSERLDTITPNELNNPRADYRQLLPYLTHPSEFTIEFEFAPELSNQRNTTTRLDLPKFSYKPCQNPEECVICKRTLSENEEVVLTDCIHKFHYDCLDEWVKHNPSCPICREPIQIINI